MVPDIGFQKRSRNKTMGNGRSDLARAGGTRSVEKWNVHIMSVQVEANECSRRALAHDPGGSMLKVRVDGFV